MTRPRIRVARRVDPARHTRYMDRTAPSVLRVPWDAAVDHELMRATLADWLGRRQRAAERHGAPVREWHVWWDETHYAYQPWLRWLHVHAEPRR